MTPADLIARRGELGGRLYLDAGELLQNVAELTTAKFGLYHTNIFLFNEEGDRLTLAASSGIIGKQMVNEGLAFPLDSEDALASRAAQARGGLFVND